MSLSGTPPEPLPAVRRLPAELRACIARYLEPIYAQQLALVSKAWQDPAERVIWREIHVTPSAPAGDEWDEQVILSAATRYRGIISALRSRLERSTYIRELDLTVALGSVEVGEILDVASSSVTYLCLREEHESRGPPLETAELVKAALRRGKRAHVLKLLELEVLPDWTAEVRNWLEFAPGVEELHLCRRNYPGDEEEIDASTLSRDLDWPVLTKLRTLRFQALDFEVVAFVVHIIGQAAPNVTSIDIENWCLRDSDIHRKETRNFLRLKNIRSVRLDLLYSTERYLPAILAEVVDPFPDLELIWPPFPVSLRPEGTGKDWPKGDLTHYRNLRLPNLQYFFHENDLEGIKDLQRALGTAFTWGRLPDWLRAFDGYPELRRIILVLGNDEDIWPGGSDPDPDRSDPDSYTTFVDLFSASNGYVDFRHTICRLEPKASITDLDHDLSDLDLPFRPKDDVEDDARQNRYDPIDCHLVTANDRDVPGPVWREMYAVDSGLHKVDGVGSRHLEFSDAAWGVITAWLETQEDR